MTDTHYELRGDHENPHHFSVGAVVMNGNTIAIIHKGGTEYTLLRETTYLDESIYNCIIRGGKEELGVMIMPTKFLGGQITHFTREGSTTSIEKTTIYFEAKVIEGNFEKNLEADELEDKVLWVSYDEAYRFLEEQQNPELEILKRVII